MIKLFDTMRRDKTDLKDDHRILVYTCGPTVYMSPHIGNWRTFIFYDTLIRTLKVSGYGYKHVVNITDVGHLVSDADEGDDKLQKQAAKERKTAWEIAEKYTREFLSGWQDLNCLEPAVFAKATDYIQQQIDMVKTLEDKGFTYTIDDGVYFDTAKDSNYGKLAKLDLSGQDAGARVEVNEQKRHPQDFALWKLSPKDAKRDMEWDSPWGKGFPGWHLECSVIAKSELGDTIDIHAGGIDHVPVHHTNEIAQSENANGAMFSNIWLHAEFMKVDGGRMGKSEGNFFTLKDLQEKGYAPLDFRLFALQAHYRTEMNFTWENLRGAKNRLSKIYAAAEMRWQAHDGADTFDYQAAAGDMLAAMQQDIDTPKAMQVLSRAVSASEQGINSSDVENANRFWEQADELLGLNVLESTPDIDDEAKRLLEERRAAREAKDFDKSDSLRAQLKNSGLNVNDTDNRQYWSRARN